MQGDEEKPIEVTRQVERLKTASLRSIEASAIRKRLGWLERNLTPRPARGTTTPRQAYELFLGDYLGLSLQDVPVVTESGSQIVWLSRNPCSTLTACLTAGLDTRTVCRSAYEKSTQAFFSWLDPQLRFIRDYEVIRPHAPHCREGIVKVDFAGHMLRAIDKACESRREGNKGYGAVVAVGERIVSAAGDSAATDGDPSLHAELKAIREAVRVLGTADLCGAVLYSTCEPCPMCTGLAVWANLTSIVYGASIADTARMGKSRITVSAAHIAEQAPCYLEVLGGVLKEECEALYSP